MPLHYCVFDGMRQMSPSEESRVIKMRKSSSNDAKFLMYRKGRLQVVVVPVLVSIGFCIMPDDVQCGYKDLYG